MGGKAFHLSRSAGAGGRGQPDSQQVQLQRRNMVHRRSLSKQSAIQRGDVRPRSQQPAVLAKGGVIPQNPEMPQLVRACRFRSLLGRPRVKDRGPGTALSQRDLNNHAPATPSDRQNHRGAQTALAGQSERFGSMPGPTRRALLISNVGVPHRERDLVRHHPQSPSRGARGPDVSPCTLSNPHKAM